MSETHQIRVLSLNCWGLKYIAKNLSARVDAIANELGRSTYDIICLQEIWVYADYLKIRHSVSTNLPYAKFFYSGALGSGLAILSRFPIYSAACHPYSLNGAPMDVAAGDWFVGKAAVSVTLSHPILGLVQVFNTHLFAKGGEDGPEYNRAHRLVNAWEFAKLARAAAELGRYVIAAGDFNSIPTTLPMTVIRDHASLLDSWVVTHPSLNASSSSFSPPPHEAITRFGVTADSPLNSYSAGKPLDHTARKFSGKRLDYILYRQPRRTGHDSSFPILHCTDCRVVFTDKVPGQNFSYSDHFGLESTLQIILNDEGGPPSAHTPNTIELSSTAITTVMGALAACYRFSKHRARQELLISGGCILILLGITVGSSWLPHAWINPIFVLFTIFVAWFATTMFYSGFIYGQWECNALQNVIEELEIHKATLEQAG